MGTLIARETPKYAWEQLGITAKIFEAHYHQPSLQDRMDQRDLLLGNLRTPDEAEGGVPAPATHGIPESVEPGSFGSEPTDQ